MEESKINKILHIFQQEMSNDVPNFFESDNAKKKFYDCFEKTWLLDFFLTIIPPKILYYNDFIQYARYDMKKPSQEVEYFLGNLAQTIETHRFHYNSMNGYPLYDFIKKSLDSIKGFSLNQEVSMSNTFNDNTQQNKEDTHKNTMIYRGHSPFLLYYIMRHWLYLPLPGNKIEYSCIKKGLLPLYRNYLSSYYREAEFRNAMATHHIAEQVLGVQYFTLIANELFLTNTFLDGMAISERTKNHIIAVLILLRHLPSVELTELFYNTLKQNIQCQQNDDNIDKYLLNFTQETLLFLIKTKLVFPTRILHAITSITEPNIPAGKTKIEEAYLGISNNAMHSIWKYFTDKININSYTKINDCTVTNLEKIITPKPTPSLESFFGFYYQSINPYELLCQNCQQYNWSFQTACEQYAENLLYIPRPQTRVSAKIDQVFRLN